jgi:hypothetical protein
MLIDVIPFSFKETVVKAERWPTPLFLLVRRERLVRLVRLV